MKIIKLSQSEDREAWLEGRRGVITGSKSKGVKPLTRGVDRTPQGFWQLLAEKVAIAPDGEKDIDRGTRLENEALELFGREYKLDIDLDPGFWVSDESDEIGYSPDGAEKSDNPTWSVEAKCLSTKNHLKFMFKDREAKKTDDYKAIDLIPNDAKNAFREQVIQSFVVNEKQQKQYFILYDDRIAFEKYMLHVIVVERKDIKDEIQAQKEIQLNVLKEVNDLIKEMKND